MTTIITYLMFSRPYGLFPYAGYIVIGICLHCVHILLEV